MNKCNVEYSCYIDKNPGTRELRFNEHPIKTLDYLKEKKGECLRIVVCPMAYKEILADLLWLDHQYGIEALCLIPQYIDSIQRQEMYDINHLLGYFRRKIFVGDTPTIIANTCISGRIYDMMDMPMLTPTFNMGMQFDEYIKFCQNFEYYMTKDIELLGWERDFSNPGSDMEVMAAKLDDIKIHFGHLESEKGVVERWNMMRQRINWDRLLFLLITPRGTTPGVTVQNVKQFDELKYNHFYIDMNTYFGLCDCKNSMYIRDNVFSIRTSAIENEFDLVNWLQSFFK